MAKKKTKNKKEIKKETEKEKRVGRKKQIKSENKILRNFLISIGLLIIFIAVFFLVSNASGKFEYRGIKFEVVQEGALTLYRTDIPVIVNEEDKKFNFFFRNDPRELGRIEFNGDLELAPLLAMHSTESFNCNGDGVIAVANLLNLYKISGIDVIKDGNATCDPQGRYAFIKMQEGNETRIDKIGNACYEVNINNCEILPATERLMIESLVEINKLM